METCISIASSRRTLETFPAPGLSIGNVDGCGPGIEEVAEIRLGMVSEKASAEGEQPIVIVEQIVREVNAAVASR